DVYKRQGQARAEWMMHRLRNLNLYPSLFVIDQISSQLRIVRPLAWNRTEIVSQCIGVKGESDADRENRIRQFEDFFNVSGMGTPDDLVEFREAQRGFQGSVVGWNDLSRGAEHWIEGADAAAAAIDLRPRLSGVRTEDEGLFVLQHRYWQEALLAALERERTQRVALREVAS
nr:benzoate 1,2-dioxygenase large subunit [Pseudomonas aeruginosa]